MENKVNEPISITPDSYFSFSGGEVHLKLQDRNNNSIKMCDYTMSGFMALAERIEIMRRRGETNFNVIYPYLPYARQDRVMEEDEPFSLKIFCNLLNSLKLNSVTIYDPHSDVAPALIERCRVIPQWEIAKKVIPEEWLQSDVMFISPDAGAYKKITKLCSNDEQICIGVKKRDASGKIIHTSVFTPQPLKTRRCLMVDDICDGGRTFIELAKEIRAMGAKEIGLYITHGIFSKGLFPLQEHLDVIFTTDSFPNKATDFLKVKEITCQ